MIIGVCGLGFSGSGAVLDLLHEYDDVDGFSNCEMSICYYPDGIEDLDYHLNVSHSRYMSSDAALYAFEKMMRSRFEYNGIHHPEYAKQIMKATFKYIDDITQVKWRGSWGYREYVDGKLKMFVVCSVLQRMSLILHKLLHKNIQLAPLETMRLSIEPEGFQERTREYLIDVLEAIGYQKDQKIFVVDQLFAGDDPEKSFKYFDDPYAIVVKRDPCDTYLLAKHVVKVHAGWIPTDNPMKFINYYRNIYGGIKTENTERVLQIQYEDLIYHYESTKEKIEQFCKIHCHSKKMKFFDPNYSIRYTQLFCEHPEDKNDIDLIAKELSTYAYQFPFKKNQLSNQGHIII